MSAPLIRVGARAVVLDPAGRILLVRFEFPHRSFWATPGGGVREGETHEQAIVRELHEETGLVDFDLGPCIWHGERLFRVNVGAYDGQRDRYFLVRVPAFEPAPLLTAEELLAEYVTDVRWWTPEKLASSREEFEPRRLPGLVPALVAGDVPSDPIDVER